MARTSSLELPSEGYYDFSGNSGRSSGIYTKGSKGTIGLGKNAWLDKLAFEQVQVDCAQFGWPVKAITRDVVAQESEWNVVFEVYVAINLLFWFLGWLFGQMFVSAVQWVVRFLPSAGQTI